MTREELTARLAECEGHTPGEWPENRNTVENLARDIEAWRGGESWKDKTGNFERSANANKKLIALAPALPSALREAWAEIDHHIETLKERDDYITNLRYEIDRLKAEVKRYDAVQECNKYLLDAALNEGDGSYKP